MLRYKEIKNALLTMITQMQSGDHLPSRPVLCKKLDTTRTTLDKAINELVQDGILQSKNGSGTYIVDPISEIYSSGGTWGIIVPNVMDAIYPGLIRGAENFAQRYGINIILCNSDNDNKKQEQYIRRLIKSKVSGLIIVPLVSSNIWTNYTLYSQLIDAKVPFVFCNRNVEGVSVPVVTSNDYYGGYIATKHLLDHGYSNIAFISNYKYRTSMDRCQGYITALMESGIDIRRRYIVMDTESCDGKDSYDTMNEMLQADDPIDAVFCFNDKIARNVCRSIEDAGLCISDDIGIIGYDNTDICQMITPNITSVAYKNVEIGEKAAELLWKLINGQPMSHFEYYLFQPEIIERESCLGPIKKVE